MMRSELILPLNIELDEIKTDEKRIVPITRVDLSQILELLTNEENHDEVCPLSFSIPLIPVRSIDFRRNQNFELGKLLRHIQDDPRDPFTRESLTLEDMSTKFWVNYDLIDKLDHQLKVYHYTRADLLAHYRISQALYEYLIQFKFNSSFKQLAKLKKWFRQHSFSAPFGVSLLIFALLSFVYGESFAAHVCLGSLTLDQTIYEAILKTFVKTQHKNEFIILSDLCLKMQFSNYHDELATSLFSKCSEMPTELFTWNYKYVFSRDYFIHAPLSESFASGYVLTPLYSMTFSFAALSGSYVGYALKHFFQPSMRPCGKTANNLLCLFMMGVLVLGLDAMTNCFGFFTILQSASSTRYSCARACNEGFAAEITRMNITYSYKFPKSSPVCNTAFFNIKAAGSSLLSIPLSFFGSRLWQNYQKRLNTNKGKQEFIQLGREKKYDYLA